MTIPTPELEKITETLRAGKKEEAAELLRGLLRQNSRNVKALVWLGSLSSNLREAEIALERALKLEPDHAAAQRYLARVRALRVGERRAEHWGDQNMETLKHLNRHRMAVLIDADNARPALISRILQSVRQYGSLRIKRIYGDWTRPSMNGWKRVLQAYAIQPMQQFQYTTGKNATDSAMIIDAMDILYADLVDGFCLVSSDSDYTRLAMRLSESGAFVMGIGKRRTPTAFINACDTFIFTETLAQAVAKPADPGRQNQTARSNHKAANSDLERLLTRAFEQAVQADGQAYLGTIGTELQRLDPSFESRKYGHKQLSQLIKAHKHLFEIESVSSKVFVRLKRAGSNHKG